MPLETVHTQEEIVSAIASSLGLDLQANQAVLTQVQDYLGDKTCFLVLDNFEHLVKEASFIPDLLKACPNLKLVVSSREKLNLSAELVYPVGGLELPLNTDSAEEAKARDSIKLFVERAKSADLRFSIEEGLADVIGICQQVNGLPLGIELAAAWVKVIPVAEIKAEIQATFDFLETTRQDALSRHQSLRAVFEHSWALLSQKEQDILKKLSIFKGGFKREVAREVAGATIPSLLSLTDKTLGNNILHAPKFN